ncbi:GGDEF domain-containing protein [Henriciella aquimarina]|uniref:GGDEF domain-containing protein n=1 Tax=Henriciella aquimarina TaxID=545261 RepID=UPI001301EF5F|nr:GGDEF domain-containing protein [Henriciella aquimarina]
MCAIFLCFWYYNRQDKATLAFAVAFAFGAIGFTLNHFVLAKDTLANAITHNTFYAAGLYLLLDGIHRAFSKKMPVLILAAIGTSSVVGATIIQASPAELSQRILWINTLQGCMFVVSAFSLWGIWKRNWTGATTYAALLLCTLNAMTLAPYNIIRSMITPETFFQTVYWGTMNVISTLSLLAMGGSLIAVCVMQRLNALREDAERDFLTGLKTRRAFEEAARQYCANRSGDIAASLILIDIDHFKLINDEYGHAAGDAVISAFGTFLMRQTRSSDLAGRMGGEEFCLLLPGTDMLGARQLAIRLKRTLADLSLAQLPDHANITASFGVAELGARTLFEDAYPMADAALYAAKTRGRDRVVCAEQPEDPGRPIRRQRYPVPASQPDTAGARIAS